MDTEGYLRKHGWRGTGHSLDVNNNGLKKPLLITKKIDVLGIGINKHDVIAGQWWMKAFDSSLKDFGTGKKSLLSQVKDHGIRRGGLYGRFVQGEGVPGTMGKELIKSDTSHVIVPPSVDAAAGNHEKQSKKKRKAEDGEDGKEAKKQRKEDKLRERADKDARRAAKKSRKEGASAIDTPTHGTSAQTSADESSKGKKKQTHEKASKKKKEAETLETLSKDKRKQYEERAKEKGLTLEEYFSRRQAKNFEASAVTFAAGENPWEGRKTEDLTEEERKARRKWMKQRRTGAEPSNEETSGNTSAASASEDKFDEQEEVLAQTILKQSRKKTKGEKTIKGDILPHVEVVSTDGAFTDGEAKAARKAAKKTLKEQKEKGKKSKKEQ